MIELAQLEQMFEGIAAGPAWDMSRPMLWGYFFTDESRQKLQALVPVLEKAGYRFAGLHEPELDDGEKPYYFLHVEREEVHTPASLFEQNAHFYALADLHHLRSYDGMDVGPLPERGAPIQ